jgi:tRNA (cytidine/uridine-2'-O-)-methyltransferase
MESSGENGGNHTDDIRSDQVLGGWERHVVLVAPEVHWNTGNIGRTCLGTGAFLHLVKPLGFSLGSKEVKRAGLDYWYKVKLHVWDDFDSFQDEMAPCPSEMVFFSKTGRRSVFELPVAKRLFLVFGSETKGLPSVFLEGNDNRLFNIPITGDIRSLNLSTAVGIALYESLRGTGFGNFWSGD